MPIDVLITNWETIKDRIGSRYDIEELCDVLGISVDDLLDKFQDLVYNNIQSLEVTTELDYEDTEKEEAS